MAALSCVVCLEENGLSSGIACPRCDARVHAKCAEDHLLNTVLDSHCPACLKDWPYDFLAGHLNKGWRLGKFKEYREDVLLDREKSLIPATQDAAALKKMLRKIPAIKKEYQRQERQVSGQVRSERYKLRRLRRARSTEGVAAEITACETALAGLVAEEYRLNQILHAIQQGRYNADTDAVTSEVIGVAAGVADRREFIKPCPAPDCRGFLSTGWKCKMCAVKVCSKCGEIETQDEEHQCDPGTLASFQLIRAESRPCPKCGVPITKISGCDHMFCTDCSTAFSWRTGEIHPTGNSNPHYHQWRAQNPGATPAPTADCDGDLRNRIFALGDGLSWEHPLEVLRRGLAHLNGYHLADLRRTLDAEELRDLRIKYILGEITEDDWKIKIQRIEKKRRKARFMYDIIELFVRGAMDILDRHAIQADMLAQVEALRTLCNKEMDRIDSMFASNVYHITADFGLLSRQDEMQQIARRRRVMEDSDSDSES